jgi:DNA-binding NtrC family response regulator
MKAIDLKKSGAGTNSSPVRVLVLEDSLPDSQEIVEELRTAGLAIEPTVVGNRGEFLHAIMSQDFGIVLSAYRLADWSGLAALKELQKIGKSAPFLIVDGDMGSEEVAEWLHLGVSDCVPKEQLARLPIAVNRALEVQRLREANDEARRALGESEAQN